MARRVLRWCGRDGAAHGARAALPRQPRARPLWRGFFAFIDCVFSWTVALVTQLTDAGSTQRGATHGRTEVRTVLRRMEGARVPRRVVFGGTLEGRGGRTPVCFAWTLCELWDGRHHVCVPVWLGF